MVSPYLARDRNWHAASPLFGISPLTFPLSALYSAPVAGGGPGSKAPHRPPSR